ncbi:MULTISPECIES: GspH/FimT family protein [unclassified Neptuniibacter]|jgi:type IV fimbrial biogenesis protein FimT|uniref:GspH/FimT family protein n=1 Tax=unclassified Neptuniibacter TaxID=2630693 RepID=UPI0026E11636|nr:MULTISPECIES: GspH/FimT family protein [unclassified Neptuniibacter]MDO6513882.1 GspH/FimT family protein [Neptuniibacter sp. 2_MG-2023]MDO6593159.1 GspH/FimT family protein [Neptuniibacter sp. 1_MG-2023]
MEKGYSSGRCWPLPIGFSKGFSLIELLLALALLSIVLFVGVPSFSAVLSRVQVDADVSSIRGGLSFARMVALTARKEVIVCRWDGDSNCTGDSGSGSLIWPAGMLVYIDEDTDGTWNPLTDSVLKVIPFSAHNEVSWNNGEKVVFQSDGSSPGYNGTFSIVDDTGELSAELVLSMTGRLRNKTL